MQIVVRAKPFRFMTIFKPHIPHPKSPFPHRDEVPTSRMPFPLFSITSPLFLIRNSVYLQCALNHAHSCLKTPGATALPIFFPSPQLLRYFTYFALPDFCSSTTFLLSSPFIQGRILKCP